MGKIEENAMEMKTTGWSSGNYAIEVVEDTFKLLMKTRRKGDIFMLSFKMK